MHDREHALHQVEVEAPHGWHATELLADQRFFGRAVHLHDADRGAHVSADGFGSRKLGQRDGGGGAAGVDVVVDVAIACGVRVILLACGRRHVGMTATARMAVTVIVTVIVIRRMGMPLLTDDGHIHIHIVLMRRNPRRMGMSARLPVLVTMRFCVAGVRHGGFLAEFVV